MENLPKLVPQPDQPEGRVGPGQACADASFIGPGELRSQPDVVLPSGKEPERAWLCSETAVATFGGVQLSWESGWEGVDVEASWRESAKEEFGEVGTINGQVALIQDATGLKGLHHQVLLMSNGTLVRLLATQDVPFTTVLALAEQLDLSKT